MQRAAAAGSNMFNFITANSKQTRYWDQLNLMLEDDIRRFKEDPRLDTLILCKDKAGGYQYDMEKVAKLAKSGNRQYVLHNQMRAAA